MAFNNCLNANSTGIQTLSSAGAWSGSAVTENGVLYGGATNAVSSLAVSDTGKMLIGNTGAASSFSATPSVTSITLSSGTALSNYTEGTWTPTMRGSTVAGTTSYTSQIGYYTRIGNIVIAQLYLDCTPGVTATGFVQITSLPFTVKNQTLGFPALPMYIKSVLTWPALTTYAVLEPIPNSATAQIFCSGTAYAGTSMNINANVNWKVGGSLIYQI